MKPLEILCVASGGGHWEQLMIVTEGLRGKSIAFATTQPSALTQSSISNGFVLPDFNKNSGLSALAGAWKCLLLVLRTRPKVILTTGAAPGLICIAAGKLVGSRTIWIDSFANAEQLSLSGRLARYVADVWLTQWKHLAAGKGPKWAGSIV